MLIYKDKKIAKRKLNDNNYRKCYVNGIKINIRRIKHFTTIVLLTLQSINQKIHDTSVPLSYKLALLLRRETQVIQDKITAIKTQPIDTDIQRMLDEINAKLQEI